MTLTFVDIMKGIYHFADAFELQYGVKFMPAHIREILDDIMASNYLPMTSRSTNMRHGELVGFCLEVMNFSRSDELLYTLEEY